MYQILLILLILVSFLLMLVVLLQSGKGGGLAAGFGGAGTGMEMMGSRQTATFLHNATKWLGGAFLVIAFVLSLMTVRGDRPQGLIERELQGQQQPAPGAQAPQSAEDLQSVLEGSGEEGPAAPGAGQGEPSPAAGSETEGPSE